MTDVLPAPPSACTAGLRSATAGDGPGASCGDGAAGSPGPGSVWRARFASAAFSPSATSLPLTPDHQPGPTLDEAASAATSVAAGGCKAAGGWAAAAGSVKAAGSARAAGWVDAAGCAAAGGFSAEASVGRGSAGVRPSSNLAAAGTARGAAAGMGAGGGAAGRASCGADPTTTGATGDTVLAEAGWAGATLSRFGSVNRTEPGRVRSAWQLVQARSWAPTGSQQRAQNIESQPSSPYEFGPSSQYS